MTHPSSPARRALTWLVVGLLLMSALVAAIFLQTRIDRELAQFPQRERNALYERTLETLRRSCPKTRGPKVAEYCQEQAEFIKHFPECDRECRDLAAQFAPGPSR